MDIQIQTTNLLTHNLFSKPSTINIYDNYNTYNCDIDKNFVKKCEVFNLGDNNYKIVLEYN